MNDLSSIHEFRNRVVIKPVIGADGVGTYLFANIQAIINSSTTAHLKSGNAWLLQDYVPEIKTLGEIGAIYIGGKLSHCVLKKPAGKDFRVQHQYGGTAELTEAPHYVDALYHDVVSALDISPTYMRLDFIPTTTPMIMEVEMVEPHKYFALCPEGAIKLAQCLVA